MPIVDSHCHASTIWYEPVETLLFEMDRCAVDQAVLIQIIGQSDNTYQQTCVARYPGRLASVVLVDVGSANASDQLVRLANEGARGVRLRATDRSPGDDRLAVWRTAQRLHMPVSCAGSAADFSAPEFARLLANLPSLVVVLEHLGSLSRPDATDLERDQRYDVFGLARYPNVYLKVPGLGEIARRALPPRGPAPFQQPLPDYFERALEAFGPQRLMWGSDFPPVASREGYRNALELCRDQFVALPEVQRALIFGGAARRVFLS